MTNQVRWTGWQAHIVADDGTWRTVAYIHPKSMDKWDWYVVRKDEMLGATHTAPSLLAAQAAAEKAVTRMLLRRQAAKEGK